jgi:branched-chain amino acid transport system substrate-binding protein
VKNWCSGVARRFTVPVALLTLVSATVVGPPLSAGASQGTNAPIVLGEVGPFSGAQAAFGGESVPKAWEAWTNAHGGIDGHPVKIVFGDDNSTTALDSGIVESLAQSDHVVAFLTVGSPDNQAISYLTAHHIPVLQQAPSGNPSNYVSLTAGQLAVSYGLIQSAKLGGAKKIGVFYCTASSFCSSAVQPFENAAAKQGLNHSFRTGVALESPNYTASCLAAKDNHVQALFVETAATQIEQIANECAAQDYKPIFLLEGVQASLSMDKVSALDGARDIVTTFPWFEDNTPATEAFQQAIRRYSPSLLASPDFGPEASLAWANAQAVAEAVKLAGVGSGTPTSAEVLAGFHKFKNESLGGLIAPVTWEPNQTSITNCYFVVATKGGKWVAPNGYGPRCAPPDATG